MCASHSLKFVFAPPGLVPNGVSCLPALKEATVWDFEAVDYFNTSPEERASRREIILTLTSYSCCSILNTIKSINIKYVSAGHAGTIGSSLIDPCDPALG